MGYDVYYSGEFVLSRPLTDIEITDLEALTYADFDWKGEVDYRDVTDYWQVGAQFSTVDGDGNYVRFDTPVENATIEPRDDSVRGDVMPSLFAIVEWLTGRGVTASGQVEWDGEDFGDLGHIEVRGSEVRSGVARIVYPEWIAMKTESVGANND